MPAEGRYRPDFVLNQVQPPQHRQVNFLQSLKLVAREVEVLEEGEEVLPAEVREGLDLIFCEIELNEIPRLRIAHTSRGADE